MCVPPHKTNDGLRGREGIGKKPTHRSHSRKKMYFSSKKKNIYIYIMIIYYSIEADNW